MMESPQLICPFVGAAKGLHAPEAESKSSRQYTRVLRQQRVIECVFVFYIYMET